MKKRVFSLLLCLALLLSLFPTALAAEEAGIGEEIAVTEPEASVEPEAPAVPEELPAEPEVSEEPEPADDPVGTDAPGGPETPDAAESPDEPAEPSDDPVGADAPGGPETPDDAETPDDPADPQPVRVIFVTEPEDAVVTVFDPAQLDENNEPTVIEPESDDSYLLLPGSYLYDASAEGYKAVEKVEFTVEAAEPDAQPQKIRVALDEIASEESTEEPFEEPEDVADKRVRVVFVTDPEDAIITVYDPSQTDEEGTLLTVAPEEDGSYLLFPGEYYYNAECMDYLPLVQVELTIEATDEPEQIVEVVLERRNREGITQVLFETDPEAVKITVFREEQNGDLIFVEAETDGSFFLTPGTYVYSASASDYSGKSNVYFSVAEGQETLLLKVILQPSFSLAAVNSNSGSEIAEFAKNQLGKKLSDFPSTYRINNDWCCWFVSYCAYHVGLSSSSGSNTDNLFPAFSESNTGNTGSTENYMWAATNQVRMANWMTANDTATVYYFTLTNNNLSMVTNRNWVEANRATFIPQPGDLIIENNYCHIGIVYSYDASNKTAVAYFGNDGGNGYQVYYRGNATIQESIGTRDIYVNDGNGWVYAGSFDYNELHAVHVTVTLSSPMNLAAVAVSANCARPGELKYRAAVLDVYAN